MKILIYTDVHWSKSSSIIREKDVRLTNTFKSVMWAERLAEKENCSEIICLGDFFDSPDLTAEELTAVSYMQWACMPHYFLVGNHETSRSDNSVSSVDILSLHPRIKIIDEICGMIATPTTEFIFVPYISEDNRKSLNEYIQSLSKEDGLAGDCKRIVFSHNDLKIQYGAYKSANGFEVEDIAKSCDLFINGHLHNGAEVQKGIINLGNLTGQNFSEDATIYPHCAMILDTDTLEYTLYENPYAFKFYKANITMIEEFEAFKSLLGDNSVVSLHTIDSLSSAITESLENMRDCGKIVAYRLTIHSDKLCDDEKQTNELHLDHLNQFVTYVSEKYDNSDILKEELSLICR